MDESFHKTKRHTAGLLCTIVPYHHLLPLFRCFSPKKCVAVSRLFSFPRYNGGSWLSRRLDWSGHRCFSRTTTKASCLSVILPLTFCEKEWRILYEDGEVTRMIDAFSFHGRKRHQIHAATTDDEWTHLDRSMR